MQTVKATVELTKNDEGIWLNVNIGGRHCSVNLSYAGRGPLTNRILLEWAESHFRVTKVGRILSWIKCLFGIVCFFKRSK